MSVSEVNSQHKHAQRQKTLDMVSSSILSAILIYSADVVTFSPSLKKSFSEKEFSFS